MERSRKYIRVQKPVRPKFDDIAKRGFLRQTQKKIDSSKKLKQKVSRIAMKGNRVYLYQLVEQFQPEGKVYLTPLIDGKYLEFPFARITINDARAEYCTADWQRHNERWISLFEGTFQVCLKEIDDDKTWFQ